MIAMFSSQLANRRPPVMVELFRLAATAIGTDGKRLFQWVPALGFRFGWAKCADLYQSSCGGDARLRNNASALLDCFGCLIEDAHEADRAGGDAVGGGDHAAGGTEPGEREAGIVDSGEAVGAGQVGAVIGHGEIIEGHARSGASTAVTVVAPWPGAPARPGEPGSVRRLAGGGRRRAEPASRC